MEITDPEAFLALLRELSEHTLIVEGRKDEYALKALGLRNIIPLNGRPLVDVVEGVKDDDEVVILTDFDKEGKRLCARLLKLLQRRRIKANPRLRRMLMTGTGIARIEELAACSGVALTKEKGDNHGEIGANFYEVCDKGKHKGKRHC